MYMSCTAILKTGAREGQPCGAKSAIGGFCGRHRLMSNESQPVASRSDIVAMITEAARLVEPPVHRTVLNYLKKLADSGGLIWLEWETPSRVALTTGDGNTYRFKFTSNFPFTPASIVNEQDQVLLPGQHTGQLLTSLVEQFERPGILVYCHTSDPREKHFALPYMMRTSRAADPDVRMDTVDILPASDNNHVHFQCDGFSPEFYATHRGRYETIYMLDAGGPWFTDVLEPRDTRAAARIIEDLTNMLVPGGQLHVCKIDNIDTLRVVDLLRRRGLDAEEHMIDLMDMDLHKAIVVIK